MFAVGSLGTRDECVSHSWWLWPEALQCVLPATDFLFFYLTVQVKKCQQMLSSALHKNCPGQTAPSAPQVQPTQPWAEGQDTSRALQLSRAPGGHPAAQLMGSPSLPILRALQHPRLQLLPKKGHQSGKDLAALPWNVGGEKDYGCSAQSKANTLREGNRWYYWNYLQLYLYLAVIIRTTTWTAWTALKAVTVINKGLQKQRFRCSWPSPCRLLQCDLMNSCVYQEPK